MIAEKILPTEVILNLPRLVTDSQRGIVAIFDCEHIDLLLPRLGVWVNGVEALFRLGHKVLILCGILRHVYTSAPCAVVLSAGRRPREVGESGSRFVESLPHERRRASHLWSSCVFGAVDPPCASALRTSRSWLRGATPSRP